MKPAFFEICLQVCIYTCAKNTSYMSMCVHLFTTCAMQWHKSILRMYHAIAANWSVNQLGYRDHWLWNSLHAMLVAQTTGECHTMHCDAQVVASPSLNICMFAFRLLQVPHTWSQNITNKQIRPQSFIKYFVPEPAASLIRFSNILRKQQISGCLALAGRWTPVHYGSPPRPSLHGTTTSFAASKIGCVTWPWSAVVSCQGFDSNCCGCGFKVYRRALQWLFLPTRRTSWWGLAQ